MVGNAVSRAAGSNSRTSTSSFLLNCCSPFHVGSRKNNRENNADSDQAEPADARKQPAGLKWRLMIRIVPCMVVLLIGCGTIPLTEGPSEVPELVRLTPLPPMSSALPSAGLRLAVMLHILKDGTVGEVRMTASSGVPEWDSLALQSIRQWQFSPARRDGVPVDLWIRQPIVVKPQEQTLVTLAEIVVATKRDADSLYVLLQSGADPDTLAMRSSIAESRQYGGHLGAVDISVYPQHVRNQLQKLSIGEITPPLKLGDRYIIYRRYKL